MDNVFLSVFIDDIQGSGRQLCGNNTYYHMRSSLLRFIPVLLTPLLLTFLCTSVRAQCPVDLDVIWESQSDVDLYAILYPACAQLSSLTIGEAGGSNIDDLSGLSATSLNRITNTLTIFETDLETLNGLPSNIAINVTIDDNDLLTSIVSLGEGLTQNLTTLSITDNNLLADCAADVVCRALTQNTTVTISGNTGSCATQTDVEDACLSACHPDLVFLRSLYNALDGPNWENNNGWPNTNDCNVCDWPYITCDVNDRVTEIRIIDDGLGGDLENLDWSLIPQLLAFELEAASNINIGPIGPIPAGLFDLPLIEEIQFRFGTFTSLPANVGNAVTLRTFVLDDEFQLAGTNALAGIGTLVNLERLVVDRTRLGGPVPAGIALLVNLKELEISGRSSGNFTFNGDLPDLSNLSILETLNFTQLPNVTGWPTMINSLANKPLLTMLLVEAANLPSPALPATFPGLTALEEFLIQTDQTGELPFLPNSGNLTSYTVNGNNINLPSSLEVAPTTSLTLLNIQENNMSGELPDIPASYSGLEQIFMGLNAFTGGIPESYNIAGLRQLNLRGNELGGFLPEFLGNLNFNFTNALDLSFNQFIGCYPASYDNLHRESFGSFTYYANFDGNPALGDFADYIQNGEACPVGCSDDYLTLVNFYYATDGENWTTQTGWEDIGAGNCDLSTWAGVTVDANGDVTGIALGNNNLSGELFPALADLDQLTNLDLSDNNFTGCFPPGYLDFCGITTDFSGNANLPGTGTATFFTDRFCTAGDACGNDCPSLPVTLTTDAEISAFAAAWPDCTNLPTDLTLSGSSITSLSPLSDLEGVDGNLVLEELSIDLGQALSEIANIGGDLTIDDCPNLITIDFNNLDNVGGGILLRDLPALTTYRLDEITTLSGDLNFTRTGLTVLDGFSDLTNIDGDLFIFGNTALTSISLDGGPGSRQAVIISAGGLTIAGNPVLTSLVGLPAFTITGNLTIASNPVLATCEADAVCNKLSVGTGTITIVGNATGCANTVEVDMACLALPVSWVSFAAAVREKTVLLNWATADETGNDRFVIERSAEGQQWLPLGEVPAGTADDDGLYHYDFTDRAPLNGSSFYRLRQTDLDGTTDYSVVRRVFFSRTPRQVFPNPAERSFTITAPTPQTVTLHTANGRLVRTIVHNGARTPVQREELKSGVYWLRFSADGEVLKLIFK